MAPKINGIIGLGVDIQRINELFPDELPEDLKSDLHLGEIFSQRELSYAASKPNPRQTLAGIYSAKEAIVKSGSNFSDYSHIQIEHSASGQPFSTGYMVSISHSGEYVISIALMLGN
jgi:NAD(P)H-hydrate epimerase